MVVITVFREEAEAVVRDERLNPYVQLYGLTEALSDQDMPYAAYVVALRPTPRDGEPIVWQREQYGAYRTVTYPNENMFAGSGE